MKFGVKQYLAIILAVGAIDAHAQFYKLKGGSISAGGTGQFTTPLTTNPSGGQFNVPTPAGGVLNDTVSYEQQFTTDSAGFLFSLQVHPVAWAGVEVNYGYNHYSERYIFDYSSSSSTQYLSVPVTTHEATAAYEFHPKHIPLQPFVNIGGGAIDFLPDVLASNQWRAAGLLETGLDIPTHNPHLAFRIEGRGLFYRAPNFTNAALSTRSWRSTEEPAASVVYRF